MSTPIADTPETVERKMAHVSGLIGAWLDALGVRPDPCQHCGGPVVHLTVFGVDRGRVCWACKRPARTETERN